MTGPAPSGPADNRPPGHPPTPPTPPPEPALWAWTALLCLVLVAAGCVAVYVALARGVE